MKSNLLLVNALGFQNDAQKAWFAANLLQSCLVSSPGVQISPLVPAIAPKAEIIAQTAKPAILTTIPAVPAAQNTTGKTFGELYLNSPAYPAGTVIPAISPKPASLAVVGVPAVVGVAAIPAVSVPAVAALPGYESMVVLEKTATSCKVTAYLPYNDSPRLIGKSAKGVGNVGEITPSAIVADKWYDTRASNFPTALPTIQPTVERMLYEAALSLVAAYPESNTIETVIKPIPGKILLCHKIVLNLPASNYDINSESIQLSLVGSSLPPLSDGRQFENQYPHPSPNKNYPSEAAWMTHVNTTPANSIERAMVAHAETNYPNSSKFYTFAGFDAHYSNGTHSVVGGYMTLPFGSTFNGTDDAVYYYAVNP